MKVGKKGSIKGIIFDFDGTLVDSMPLWQEIDRLFLAERGIEVPQGLGAIIAGFSFTETARYFKKTFALKESVEEIKAQWKAMSQSLYPLHVKLKPGCREVLEVLTRAGFSMAIGSSNNKEVIRELLEREGLLSYFLSVKTSCDVGRGKPYPDLFLSLAREMQIVPGEICIVDDIIEGIRAGKRAGMKTVAVYDAGYGKRKLLEKEADRYIISLYELPPWLGAGPFTP
ncbi:MAG TPA: HAD family phosphatase [Candidatus Mcinerneyibacteriales bacterium]|nr:HAD family phosphatase [Candidatus Mcinerneyibacteriales bacterium]HPE21221.1 HAD family phosphatase [Candidatus Mcinerneyibacteriales bacterium]